jgi:hypothetical protein
VEIVTDPQITRDRLADFPVLVLPNAACLEDAQIEEIETYVSNGGALVCTGETSLWDAEGQPRGSFGLTQVLGVRFDGHFETHKTHVALVDTSPLAAGIDLREPLVTFTPQIRFLGTDKSATVHARVVYPWAHEESSFTPLRAPGDLSMYPSIISRRCGRGTAYYLGCFLDSDYYDHGHPSERRILTNAVLAAAVNPPLVTIDGPATLRMTVFQRPAGNEVIVHVVNFTASYLSPTLSAHASIDRIIPVSGVKLRIQGRKPVRVRSFAQGRDLDVDVEDGERSFVELPPIPVHEILTLDF